MASAETFSRMIDDLVLFDSIMEQLAHKATEEMILERHLSQLKAKWDAIEAVHQSIITDTEIKQPFKLILSLKHFCPKWSTTDTDS